MKAYVSSDPERGIVISDEMTRAAGIAPGEKLAISITPGQILIQSKVAPTEIVLKDGLTLLKGGGNFDVPISEALRIARESTW